MFIFVIIFAVIAVIAFVTAIFLKEKKITLFAGAISAVTVIIITILSSFFAQDVGESSVLRDLTGNIVGEVSDSGLHGKAPWDTVITYEVRNQRVVFLNPSNSTGDNSGGSSDGREISVIDKDGVSSNVDVTVRYNINPSKVIDIYKQYKTEDNLKATLIFNDIRSVVRSQAGKFNTLELLTQRDKVSNAIREDLASRWKNEGVLIDEVALQQIDPPKAVKDSYSIAQKSQIEVQKATNDLNATKVSAQKQVVEAQAQADANNLISQSLTPQVLQQKYLDALGKGTIYVVPQGSTPFIGTK